MKRPVDGMTDEELLALWRSWLDKDAMPEDYARNLWDEFYALQHRRDQWRAYHEMLLASPEDAQRSARWLTQVMLRNHIEAQAAAIRRFAYSGRDDRPMAFGKILRDVARRPSLFGDEASREAARDLADLEARVAAVDTFADMYVAHLDRDHKTAVPPQTIDDMDEAVQFLGPLWGRWYTRIVGQGVDIELIPETGWASFLRLERHPGPYETLMRSLSAPPPPAPPPT